MYIKVKNTAAMAVRMGAMVQYTTAINSMYSIAGTSVP